MEPRWWRAAALVAVGLVFVTAACGQKGGVAELPLPLQHAAGGLPPGATVDPETGEILDAEGNVIGTVGEDGVTLSGDPGDATLADSSGDAAAEDNDDTRERPAGDANPEPGSDGNARGVSQDTIKVGAHAPLTGAAPLPSNSVEMGNDLYWKWLTHSNQLINGRRVEVFLKNDNYSPSQAVAVCKELVERHEVFLLYGYAGTDQITACARYAASVDVPYVSMGVTESIVSSLPEYLAITLSYPEQTRMLADMLASKLGAKGEKNGLLTFDTASFQDARDEFIDAMRDGGMPLAYDREVSKHASSSEARTVVQEMKVAGIENVFVLTSPVWFLQVLQASQTQAFEPQWVGVGLTKALDSVASVGCRNGTLNGAKFFSPFPAWAEIDRFDPTYARAVQAVYPDAGRGDDIMVLAWGFTKVVGELLELPGSALTRERFLYFAERTRNLKTGVYPPVSFSPDDHLGGTQVHLNEAHCSGYKSGDNRWHTIQSFVSDF